MLLPALHTAQADAVVGGKASSDGNGELILVVEDNQNVRAALVSSLHLLNYRTLEAENGRNAMDVFQANSLDVDVILSDLVMPEMGGKALVHAIRERSPGIPIVLVSGHWLQTDAEELRELGLIGWLRKPPTLDDIAEAMARALAKA